MKNREQVELNMKLEYIQDISKRLNLGESVESALEGFLREKVMDSFLYPSKSSEVGSLGLVYDLLDASFVITRSTEFVGDDLPVLVPVVRTKNLERAYQIHLAAKVSQVDPSKSPLLEDFLRGLDDADLEFVDPDAELEHEDAGFIELSLYVDRFINAAVKRTENIEDVVADFLRERVIWDQAIPTGPDLYHLAVIYNPLMDEYTIGLAKGDEEHFLDEYVRVIRTPDLSKVYHILLIFGSTAMTRPGSLDKAVDYLVGEYKDDEDVEFLHQ